MSKFKKKKGGELPPISTASLPDIVFMLLFFFMVATVLRDNNVLVQQNLPSADQTEKLKKDRTVFIYAGAPGVQYQERYGKEGKVQIGDKFVNISEVKAAILEAREGLRDELKDKVIVALKVDKETNSGLVQDIKEELREANMLKIIYVTPQAVKQ